MGSSVNENWKEKYFEQQKQLKILSGHCIKVIEKHEELVRKSEETKKQYDVVVGRLQEREKQLLHVRKLLEPVYSEYASLKEKYEIEQECRHQAEQYASKITKENRVLKRQSANFLDEHEGTVPIDDEQDLYKNYLETLNAKIEELEEEKTQQSAALQKMIEDYGIERENHAAAKNENDNLAQELKKTKTSLHKYKETLEKMASASSATYDEYIRLRNEFESANACKSTAENFAKEIYAQNEAIKRQSSVLLNSAMSDERLMKALMEVETLSHEKELQKTNYEQQIKDLQEDLDNLKDADLINSLEADNQALQEDREQLNLQLTEIRDQYSKHEKQYKELQKQYKDLEDKYELVLHPPPPPPPPLPPISVLKPKGFLSRTKSKRTREKVQKCGGKADATYSQAINEMMDRIKGGGNLRKVLKPTNRRPSCPNESEAVEELHNMLTRMKRNRSMGDLLGIDEEEGDVLPDSELKKTFQKIRSTSKDGI